MAWRSKLACLGIVPAMLYLGSVAGRWGGFVWVFGLAVLAYVLVDSGQDGPAAGVGLLAILVVVPAIIWFASVTNPPGGSSRSVDSNAIDVDGCVGVVLNAIAADRHGVSGSSTAGMRPGEKAAYKEADSIVPELVAPTKVNEIVYTYEADVRSICERVM